jgi:uncharacterized membrane protein (UPF0136 family)
MNPGKIPALLDFYGIFLIICGIISVIFIGLKAKTALISGGTSGVLAIVTGYLLHVNTPGAAIAGIVISGGLFIVFAWRSTKTLFRIFELIPSQDQELKGKGIAFLIISLMAVVSIFVFALQIISYGG